MAELLILLTTIAVVAAALLEKTPEGVRLNKNRLEDAWQSVSRKLSASAKRLHESDRERHASAWRTVGVSESRIEEFERVWGKAPSGPQSLGYWRTALDCENQEATDWRRVFRKVEICRPWKQVGIPAHDAQTWLGLDREMNPQVASQWMRTGMRPEVAYSWHSRAYSPDGVERLSAGGLLSYDDATKLLIVCADIGYAFESIDFKMWFEAGFRDDITSVFSWIASNFTATEASPWHAMRLDANTSRSWVDAGFSASEAQFWVENEFSVSTAKTLFEHGFRGPTITPWRSRWHDVEFVTAWSTAGFASSEEAQAWADHGFSPIEAARWRDTKAFDPESAREWSKHQFSPDKATPWKTTGLTAERAQMWAKGGIVEPVTVRGFDSLLTEGGVSRDVPKIIGQICERISRGDSSGQIEQIILREFPAIGGDIGVRKSS